MIWFFSSSEYLFYVNYNTVYLQCIWTGETRDNISLVGHLCFGLFLCPCYSRRTHPALEKPGVQNIAASKYQGKQRQPIDEWTSIKTLFWKKVTGWRKKDKNVDWNTSFEKRFYILQNQIKFSVKESDAVS